VLRLAKGLIDRGHSVDILVFSAVGPLAHLVPSEARLFPLEHSRLDHISHFHNRLHLARHFGIKVLGFLWAELPDYANFMAKYIDRKNPDCILPSLEKAKSAACMASIFTKFKPPLIIPIIHSNLANRKWKWRSLYSILFPSVDHVVTVSDGVADSVVSEIGLSPEKITRIYNPVFSEEIEDLAKTVPDHPWLNEDEVPVILAAGRLARVKDFPTLLHAFERVAKNRKVRLIIIGEGSWRKRLEKMVKKLNIESAVSLPGWVPNPYAYMSRASLFVLSSRYEGLANVLIEALACGCPCVSTDCPSGPAEILDDGRFGLLVPVGDVPALSTAMERLLDYPSNKDILVARAKEFSVEAAAEQYERAIADQLYCRHEKHAI